MLPVQTANSRVIEHIKLYNNHKDFLTSHIAQISNRLELPQCYRGDLVHDGNAIGSIDPATIKDSTRILWILRECGTYIETGRSKVNYLDYARKNHSLYVAIIFTIDAEKKGSIEYIEAVGI